MEERIMKRSIRYSMIGFCAVLSVGLVSLAVAQVGGSYDLSWNTMDGGGGTATGGTYSLSGTVGQCDAGVLSGGTYTLAGGFWGGVRVGETSCGCDLNCDGVVDARDLCLMIRYEAIQDLAADFDGDNDVDRDDCFFMSLHWREVTGP